MPPIIDSKGKPETSGFAVVVAELVIVVVDCVGVDVQLIIPVEV